VFERRGGLSSNPAQIGSDVAQSSLQHHVDRIDPNV